MHIFGTEKKKLIIFTTFERFLTFISRIKKGLNPFDLLLINLEFFILLEHEREKLNSFNNYLFYLLKLILNLT